MEKTKKIDELSGVVDSRIDEIAMMFEGVSIRESKAFLRDERFKYNPTKRKLVDILEAKLSQKINERNITI